jgi:hypothetical protein
VHLGPEACAGSEDDQPDTLANLSACGSLFAAPFDLSRLAVTGASTKLRT